MGSTIESKFKNVLNFNGIKIKIGKKYKWEGISIGLYTSHKWSCKMKIINIVNKTIYIKSNDDNKITEWNITDLIKNNIIIKKHYKNSI